MARETRLWDWMRDEGRGIRELDMARVESRVTPGFPDVDACYAGRHFQLELKGADRPARSSTPVRLPVRREQVVWLTRRWRAGGCCWLYCRVGYGPSVRRYLLRPLMAEAVMEGRTEEWLAGHSVLPPDHSFRQLIFRASERALEDGPSVF